MGALSLPDSGVVYVDVNSVIYSVERIAPYAALLEPLWQAAAEGRITVISSELAVLEALVKPIRDKNEAIERAFRAFLFQSDEFRLAPIELPVVERATQIRAATGLKAPDAIHAATALQLSAALFITNDAAFRRVQGLSVVVLSDLLAA